MRFYELHKRKAYGLNFAQSKNHEIKLLLKRKNQEFHKI